MDGFKRFNASETKAIHKNGGNYMKKFFAKRLKNEKGLTLIELLAVIVILAIIAAIAVPAVGKIINNSKDKAILADASNILAGAKIAIVDGSCKDENKCVGTELNDFVEGITLEDTTIAEKDTDGKWSITYPKFGSINNDKFKSEIKDNKTTEENLNKLMGNK